MSATSPPPPVVTWTERIESARALDPVVGAIARLAGPVLGPESRRRTLQGYPWLGHAVHPVMTDVPLGMWTSAIVLDLVGGRRSAKAAQRLVGLGLLAAAPTALTGLAEWEGLPDRDRRVGVVHAASNGAAAVLFAASWRARRRSARGRGAVLSLAGGVVATVGGYLGGHLTEVRDVSSSHPAFHEESAPPP